ncbi:hypothetical protein NDN08_007443 [Rhodosorus marinus]|uniref:BED-type domain-containing protein n=1 Tax=Rhodosorus marinus TaxID=101924 RepID=A0AAV8UZ41_9RHOD|nr:hypothetical protein NDN08_007443 [Rhodosorus marinus]
MKVSHEVWDQFDVSWVEDKHKKKRRVARCWTCSYKEAKPDRLRKHLKTCQGRRTTEGSGSMTAGTSAIVKDSGTPKPSKTTQSGDKITNYSRPRLTEAKRREFDQHFVRFLIETFSSVRAGENVHLRWILNQGGYTPPSRERIQELIEEEYK